MRCSFDSRNWGLSYTKLTSRSVLAAMRVNRIIVIGPLAIGWWSKERKFVLSKPEGLKRPVGIKPTPSRINRTTEE